MLRPALAIAGLLQLLAPAAAKPHIDGCSPDYQCIFRWIDDAKSLEYTWDFRTLCRAPGNEYFFRDSVGQNYTYNICGNVSTPCLHRNAFSAVAAHGVMVQTWGSGPYVNPACKAQECGMGNPLCCEDIEYPGYYGCCTAECEVIAHTRPEIDLVDPSNPATGGIMFTHDGMMPMAGAPDSCPTDPLTNFPRPRKLNIRMFCDPTLTRDTIVPIGLVESPVCTYNFDVYTGAACGIKGDPFDLTPPASASPGNNFSFVVLGAFLAVGLQVGWSQASKRGWLDMARERMGMYTSGGSRVSATLSTTAATAAKDGAAAAPLSASGGYGSL